MLSWLFSCCGRRKLNDPEALPDERTPMIPATEDTPITQPRVVDHQRLKERLGSVLKSKETKMVNVNAEFPFNLHNQRLDDPSPSRSSRNVSGGTYGSSRHASLSPHPSIKKSRSSASVPGDHEIFSSQVLPPHRLPAILNVKLVKVGGSSDVIESLRSADEKREFAGDAESTGPVQHPQPSLSAQGPPSHHQVVPSDLDLDQHIASPESFTFHDAGAVSRSWRD